MVNRNQFRLIPKILSIAARQPPISTNLSKRLQHTVHRRRPLLYRRHGGIPDHHISRVLRPCHRPQGLCDDLPRGVTFFEVLCVASEVWPLELVFLLKALVPWKGEAQRMLAGVSNSVVTKDFVGFLGSPPTKHHLVHEDRTHFMHTLRHNLKSRIA